MRDMSPVQCLEHFQKHRAQMIFTSCVNCVREFSLDNVFTAAGWRETQISGLCEKCWDALFAEEEE